MFPFSYSQDHVGIIGLSIEDIGLAFSAIAGPDPLDSSTVPLPATTVSLHAADVKPPRIGVVRNFFPELTEPLMQTVVDASAGRLAAAGADVRDVNLPREFALTWMTYRLIYGAEHATIVARADAAKSRGGEPVTFEGHVADRTLTIGREGVAAHRLRAMIPTSYYLQSQRIRRWIVGLLCELYSDDDLDILMMATAPGPAPHGLEDTGNFMLLLPWTHLGLPAISVQSGAMSPEGLPLGLQFVGPPLADVELLRAGRWIESILGRLPSPPV